MAVRTGLEPATSCVTGRHSNQLNYRTKLRGQDLNLRPPGYEPDELPDCSTPQQDRVRGIAGSPPRFNAVRRRRLIARATDAHERAELRQPGLATVRERSCSDPCCTSNPLEIINFF